MSTESNAAGLEVIRELVAGMASGKPMESSLSLICRRISEVADFRFCGVLVPSADWTQFRFAGGFGFPDTYAERLAEFFLVPVGEQAALSPTRQAADRRQTVVTADALDAADLAPWRSLALEYGFRAMVSVPLIAQGEVIGVLNGYSARPGGYRLPLATVEEVAAHAAIALHVGLLLEERGSTIATLERANGELVERRRMLERAEEIHTTLTRAALTGADPAGITAALSTLIDHPVAVTDIHGATRFVAAGGEVSDVGTIPDTDAANRIAVPIRLADETIGEVLILDAPGSELDRRAAEHAATVLALDEVKRRVALATEDRLRADLLSELLQTHLVDTTALRERAARHGLRLGSGHRVLILRMDAPEVRTPRADALARTHLDALTRELGRRAGWFVSSTGFDIVAIVPQAEDEALVTLLPVLQRRTTDRLEGATLSIGIGSVLAAVDEVARSYGDARLCTDLGARLGRPGQIIRHDDLGVLGLLLDARRPELLGDFVERTLGPAIHHDSRYASGLISTLRTYLDCSCDYAESARRLYVHQNTIKYRLRRIEELCDLRLRNPSDLVAVRVATLALTLREG